MKKTLNIILLLILFCSSAAYGQVNWSFNLIGDKTASPALEITATIGHGYHLYAIDNPDGGMPLQFFFDFKGCKPSGSVTADKNTLSPIMTFSNLTNIIILEQLNSRKN